MKRHKSDCDIVLRRIHLRIYAYSPAWWLTVILSAFGMAFVLTMLLIIFGIGMANLECFFLD